MWALVLFSLTLQLSPPAHVRLGRADMATVTSLAGTPRGGRTFVTFTKGGTAPYTVYESASQITSLSGLTPIATLDADSYRFLWDDSATVENLHSGFLIPGSSGESVNTTASRRMLSSEGLIVLTPPVTRSRYFAVTNAADQTITVGVNSLTSPVSEVYQAIPDLTFVNAWTQPSGAGTNLYRMAFDWEDYSTWYHGNIGYYGNKFIVTQSATANPLVGGTLYPATLYLHGGGSNQYAEPDGRGDNTNTRGFYVSPVDMSLTGVTGAPTYHAQPAQSGWTGYPTQANPSTIQRNWTAIRVVRYIRAFAAIPGNPYQIDPTRLYISGGSLGGMDVHIAYDAANAGVFAAVDLISGIPTYQRFTGCSGAYGPTPELRLDTDNQLVWREWANVNVSILQARDLPPALYGWGTDDTHPPCIFKEAVDTAEAAKQAVFARWVLGGGHGNTAVIAPGESTEMYLRFKTNEAYPAFSSVSNNDDDGNMTASGQHNLKVDWQCSQHSITGGAAITDTVSAFALSLISLSGTPTATITIRNAQAFLPSVGEVVLWSTNNGQSGSATRNSDGSVTAAGFTTPLSAMRLTFSVQGPTISTTARIVIQHE